MGPANSDRNQLIDTLTGHNIIKWAGNVFVQLLLLKQHKKLNKIRYPWHTFPTRTRWLSPNFLMSFLNGLVVYFSIKCINFLRVTVHYTYTQLASICLKNCANSHWVHLDHEIIAKLMADLVSMDQSRHSAPPFHPESYYFPIALLIQRVRGSIHLFIYSSAEATVSPGFQRLFAGLNQQLRWLLGSG